MTPFYRRGVRLCIFPVPSTFLAQKPSRHIFLYIPETFVLFIQSWSLDTFGMPWLVSFHSSNDVGQAEHSTLLLFKFQICPSLPIVASVCPIFLSFFLPPHSLFRPPIVILLLFITVFPSALLHNRQVRGTGMS